MNASGGALHAITAASDSSSRPDWSPSGTSMVFERRTSEGNSPFDVELYSVNADGTGLRRLAECREDCVGDSQPAYSPDGGRIAFIRSFGPLVEGVYPQRRSVVAVNADGSGLREILSFDVLRDRRIPQDPQWSPDGRRLALTVYTDASIYGLDVGVFTVNVDGSALRRLVPFTSFEADWAPGREANRLHDRVRRLLPRRRRFVHRPLERDAAPQADTERTPSLLALAGLVAGRHPNRVRPHGPGRTRLLGSLLDARGRLRAPAADEDTLRRGQSGLGQAVGSALTRGCAGGGASPTVQPAARRRNRPAPRFPPRIAQARLEAAIHADGRRPK